MSDASNPSSGPGENQFGSGSKQQGGQGIRLPPISFLSNLPQLQNNNNNNTQPNEGHFSGSQSLLNPSPNGIQDEKNKLPPLPPSSSGLSGILNDNNPIDSFKSRPPLLNNLLSSNDNGRPQEPISQSPEVTVKPAPLPKPQTDEEIIKYYSEKYEIFDLTDEEKHDILQHEKRSRIEALKNPNYKPFLCYSIIKRLNAVQPVKRSEEKEQEVKKQPQPEQPIHELPTQEQPPSEPINQPVKRSDDQLEVNHPPTKFVKREIIINNDDVLSFASKFPRKHLGSILYHSHPVRSSYDILPFYEGPKSKEENKNQLVSLLPELGNYINSIITVRVSSNDLTDIRNNEHYKKRSIWGTDVYTDDSDILLILKHNGFLPVIDEEFETENEIKINKQTPGNNTNKQNITQSVKNFRQFINIIGGDIHVDLIVLPALERYEGIYRHGINSRSWRTGHDGVSIALYGVRYGEKNSAVESVNNSEVKKTKLRDFLQLRDDSKYETDGERGWKLSYKAWKAVKEQKD